MNKMVVVTVCEEKHQRLLRAFVRLFSFFLLSCVCACGRFVSYFFGSADLFLLFSFFFLLIFTIKYFYVRTKMTGKNYLNDETDVKTSTDLDRYGCEKHLCTRPIITKWFFWGHLMTRDCALYRMSQIDSDWMHWMMATYEINVLTFEWRPAINRRRKVGVKPFRFFIFSHCCFKVWKRIAAPIRTRTHTHTRSRLLSL